MFAVYYDRKGVRGYVLKADGTNHFVKSIWDASHYPTKEAAEAGKVGHHKDMGGDGFFGRIVPLPRRSTRVTIGY